MCRKSTIVILIVLKLAGAAVAADKVLRPEISNESFERVYHVNKNGDFIYLPAQVGGRKYQFVFETGMSRNAFLAPLHSSLGKKIRSEVAVTFSGDGGISAYEAKEIEVAGIKIPAGTEAFLLDKTWLELLQSGGVVCDGMLGIETIKKFVVQIDFDRGTLKWLREFVPEDEFGIRIRLEAPGFVPNAQIYIPGYGYEYMAIDTGNIVVVGATFTKDVFVALEEKQLMHVVNQQLQKPSPDGSLLVKERVGFLRRTAYLEEMEMPECAFAESKVNTLGMGFLRRYLVTFDFPKGMMYLKPGKQIRSPERVPLSGITICMENGKKKVLYVEPQSPGDQAGCQRGDVLVKIQGRDCESLSVFDINLYFHESGQTVALTVLRGPRTIDLNVKLPTLTPPKRVSLDMSKKKKFLPVP